VLTRGLDMFKYAATCSSTTHSNVFWTFWWELATQCHFKEHRNTHTQTDQNSDGD